MFTSGSSHMCMVHNSIFRGYNSIYHQAPYITAVDKPAFVGYCLAWYKFLKTHADNEDISLFPKTEELLEDNTIFTESHKEHGMSDPSLWSVVRDRTGGANRNTCSLQMPSCLA
jgi:hypothetical protein